MALPGFDDALVAELEAQLAQRVHVVETGEGAVEFHRTWERRQVGPAAIDCLTYDEAVLAVCTLAQASPPREYVVTPNIQHIALLRKNVEFAAAYADAALVLPDGAPVVLALRALTGRKQARVTGTDLLPGVCRAAAAKGLTVGLLGGRPGAAEEAAWQLAADYPKLDIVLVEEAPHGFEDDPIEFARILEHVQDRDPDILFVGLGTPKQETWVHQHGMEMGSGVALCVGAAIDYMAGYSRRAPWSWQRWGCEWLWRVLHEPRRLAGRYLRAAPVFLREVGPAVAVSLLRRLFRRGRSA